MCSQNNLSPVYHNYRRNKHQKTKHRGTQRIVSVNYLLGRPLIPYNFLKAIFTSHVPEMENLRPSVFGLIKISGTKERSAKIFGKEIRLYKVFGKWTKMP